MRRATAIKWITASALATAAVASGLIFFFHRPPPSLDEELRGVARQMQFDQEADGISILANLHGKNVTDREIASVSYALLRALTIEQPRDEAPRPARWRPGSLPEVETPLSPAQREALNAWLRRAQRNEVMNYVFQLAHSDYGSARATLRFFLQQPDLVPYFDLLLGQAAKSIFNLDLPIVYLPETLSEGDRSTLRRLFRDDTLIRWAKARPANLQQFSGMTNTVIGIYDWISYPEYREATGFQDFPDRVDVRYDLGGGFATPDIERLIGHPLISLDLISPREAENWDLNFYVLKKWQAPSMGVLEERPQSLADRQRFRAALRSQPWEHLDVFENPLPANFHSYFITSFGFLSSTVSSLSDSRLNKIEELLYCYRTTYMAVRRIVELVAKGKEVTLFSYQRASEKRYRYRTAFLEFKDHRLTRFKLWPTSPVSASGPVLRRAAAP